MNHEALNDLIITGNQLQRLEKLLEILGGIGDITSETYTYAPISSVLNLLAEDFDCLITEIKGAVPADPSPGVKNGAKSLKVVSRTSSTSKIIGLEHRRRHS